MFWLIDWLIIQRLFYAFTNCIYQSQSITLITILSACHPPQLINAAIAQPPSNKPIFPGSCHHATIPYAPIALSRFSRMEARLLYAPFVGINKTLTSQIWSTFLKISLSSSNWKTVRWKNPRQLINCWLPPKHLKTEIPFTPTRQYQATRKANQWTHQTLYATIHPWSVKRATFPSKKTKISFARPTINKPK